MRKILVVLTAVALTVLVDVASGVCADRRITIVFTGQAHGSLYPCTCPAERIGGLARRATAISQKKEVSRDVIVVEAGLSFSDQEAAMIGTDRKNDQERTRFYLKAVKTMGYDALLVSSQEFLFGADFLKEYKNLPFVSSNTGGLVHPYIIKEMNGLKVGMIGLTDRGRADQPVPGWQEPVAAVKKVMKELKGKKVNLVMLLSALSRQEDEKIAREVPDIDVIINGSESLGSVTLTQAGRTRIFPTWWEARQVGIFDFTWSPAGISDGKLSSVILDEKVPGDEKVNAVLPACLSQNDCMSKAGFDKDCAQAGTMSARCDYQPLSMGKILIVEPSFCRICRSSDGLKRMEHYFGKMEPEFIREDSPRGQEMIKSLGLTMLPAFVFPKSVEENKGFSAVSQWVDQKKDYDVIKEAMAGVSYLVAGERVSNRLELFFDLQYPQNQKLFDMVKALKAKHPELDLRFNFLAGYDPQEGFLSKGKPEDIAAFKSFSCVQELEPAKTMDYIACVVARGDDQDAAAACAAELKMDPKKISDCVSSERGDALLKEKLKRTEELRAVWLPTFVWENKEVFSVVNVPSVKEMEDMLFGPPSQPGEKGGKK